MKIRSRSELQAEQGRIIATRVANRARPGALIPGDIRPGALLYLDGIDHDREAA